MTPWTPTPGLSIIIVFFGHEDGRCRRSFEFLFDSHDRIFLSIIIVSFGYDDGWCRHSFEFLFDSHYYRFFYSHLKEPTLFEEKAIQTKRLVYDLPETAKTRTISGKQNKIRHSQTGKMEKSQDNNEKRRAGRQAGMAARRRDLDRPGAASLVPSATGVDGVEIVLPDAEHAVDREEEIRRLTEALEQQQNTQAAAIVFGIQVHEDDDNENQKCRRFLVCFVMAVLLVAGVVAGVVVSLSSSSTPVGDGTCDLEFNTERFGWDGGDCCADEDCQKRFDGADGTCDLEFNTEAFGWDGGDCCNNNDCNDLNALSALYAGTNGPGWNRKDLWLTSPNVCSWFGVDCVNGRATELLLGTNLYRSIPMCLSTNLS